MEAPISASQGAMRSLPRKLESLLSGPKHELRAAEKKKLRGLQADLQEIIDKYLIEPSEVVSPASTANSWMKDVRDLSYDIDDFIYELAHVVGGGARISAVKKPPRFKISRFPEKLRRRRWVTDEISRFRTRVKEAIHLHKECLGNCKLRPSSSGKPPPSPSGRLVGVDSSIQQLCGWLANDGHPEHRVVSIVGTGGVGKTTLATEVYRRLQGQFQCLAFVRTSPNADMKGLLTSILSQVRRHRHLPDDALDVHKLVISINEHLQHKTYLIVIEDLWALSTWDLVNRALPKENCCSRILMTTEADVIAKACCADNFKFIPAKKEDNTKYMPSEVEDKPKYMPSGKMYMPSKKKNHSKYIIMKEPLSEDDSRELFFNRAFGEQAQCPQGLKEVSNEIIKRSGGLPLGISIFASLLAQHPASSIEQWNYIKNSLSSDLTTHASGAKINQVLKVGYDSLPHDLKACMLYLCMYEEDCVIWKDDLLKQWIAEGFISAVKEDDKEEVAHNYFRELVSRGMIQPVDTNCSAEILSCRVHHLVLHFIRDKSMKENFCIAIDQSHTTIRLADKVRRLALHFSNLEDATPPGPESMRLSKVRSIAFSGFHKCVPSMVEFRFIQVLNIKLSVDPDKMMSHNHTGCDVLSGIITEPEGLSYNLTEISELFRLRYFHLDACHMSVALPTQMQQLKFLVAWEIDAEVTAVASDIVDLPSLLYLRIPSEAHLPSGIGRMISLRTLGVFNLSKNSSEDVMSLSELTNLQDLRLACSTVQPHNLEKNLECLGLVIRKLSNLKCVTLVPAVSSHVSTQNDAGASSMSTSWNGFNIVPLPPALLQRLELSRRCCHFSSLPEWTKELTKLCILKIGVRKVSQEDVAILKGLPSLTTLSLFIWTAPAIRIIFDNEGFSVLKYFKFVCAAPRLEFLDGAMPNVRKLKLGFNANRMDRIAGLKRLAGLNEVSIKIGDPGAVERQREPSHSVLTDAIGINPSTPIINIQWVDWNFCGEDEKHSKPREEIRDQTSEKQNVTAGISSDEHEFVENNLEEDVKKQPDTGTYASPKPTFHLHNTEEYTCGRERARACCEAMSVVGEMIASAVVKQITTRLCKLLEEEITRQWKFKDEVVKMSREIEFLQAVMHDADNKVRRGGTVGEQITLWLRRLKTVFFDLEDVLDDLETKNNEAKHKVFFSRENQVLQWITRPHNLEYVQKEIKKIKTDGMKFNLEPKAEIEQRQPETYASRNSEGIPNGMQGRIAEKQKLINLILRSEANERISIIPIVGLGGIGKTTLAQSIWADNILRIFEIQVWVHVSDKFDLLKIARTIIRSVDKVINLDGSDLHLLQNIVREKLTGKKYLIVLDDFWEEDEDNLEHLKNMLRHGSKGSKIIVTTRNQTVVEIMSTGILAHQRVILPVLKPAQISLGTLETGHCWELIKIRAFGPYDVPTDLEEIGYEIASKCGGIPLVANAFGTVMSQNKSAVAWENIKISLADLVWRSDNQKGILESLKLSYSFMKLDYKICFAYLAAFPKGFIIDSNRLIQQWKALEYIYSELDGESCIKYLLAMSFLQISRNPSASQSSGRGHASQHLTMHDLVHDLASIITGGEFLVLDADDNKPGKWKKHIHCRHAELKQYKNQPNVFEHLPEKLRSLHIRDSQTWLLPPKAFSGSKYMRVLDLTCPVGQLSEGQSTSKLPRSIKKMRLLRYLDATGLPLSSLPESMERLQNIKTLIMSKCSLETLPDNVSGLHKLCYLDLSGNTSLSKLPMSLGMLSTLSFLNLSGCSILQELPESIYKLSCLQHLDMSQCCATQNLPSNFGDLPSLLILSLSGCSKLTELPVTFGRLPKLSFLSLSGCSKLTKLPDSVSLDSLKYLNLSGCHELENLPEEFGKLQNLVVLNLSDCHKVSMLPKSFCQIIHLTDLDLSDCHELKELPDCFGDLSKLETLNLRSCSKLEQLPESLHKLKNLVCLNLSDCYKVSVLPKTFSQLTHLKDLDLSDCHELKELPDCFGALSQLESLNLSSCSKLEQLPESLCTMLNLRVLNMSYCTSLQKLPSLLGQLKLQKLDISATLALKGLPDGIDTMTSLTQFEISTGHSTVVEKAEAIKKNLGFPSKIVHNVQKIENNRCSNIVELAQLTCPEVEVIRLHNVKNPEDAERARLRDKSDLRLLSLKWVYTVEDIDALGVEAYISSIIQPDRNDKSVLERLLPPRTLEQFLLEGYMSTDFPSWMSDIPSFLPFLTFVGISGLGECDTLPPFGGLPNLRTLYLGRSRKIRKIGSEFYGDSGKCRKLRVMSLCSMDNLEEWWTTRSGAENEEFLIPNLHSLTLVDCPKLKFQPYPPRSMQWELNNSDKALPEGGFGELQCSVDPFEMVLINCHFSPNKWRGLEHFPTLEILTVQSCSGLRALLDVMQFLTSLTALHLFSLDELSALPECLEQLTSLQTVFIVDCPNLTFLPESVKNLTTLKKLHIERCPILVRRCQGEDAHKISHIPEVILLCKTDMEILQDLQKHIEMSFLRRYEELLLNPEASTSGGIGAWTYGDTGASTSGDAGAQTYGDAGASTSEDAGASTSEDAGPSTSCDPMREN